MKGGSNFTKQFQTQGFSWTHCLQSSLRTRYAWSPTISLQCDSQDLVVQEARTSGESQQDAESNGETLRRFIDLDGENCKMDGKISSQSWLGCPRNISMSDNSLNTWVKKAGDQQTARNLFNYPRILQNFNVLIATLFRYRIQLLQLREKFEVLAEAHNIAEDQLRCYFHSLALLWRRTPVEDQNMVSLKDRLIFYRAKQMQKKARQTKHGKHPTILSRCCEQEGYRKSLAEHKIGKKGVMLFDRIFLERHDKTGTRAERLQNAEHCILRLNADAKPSASATRMCRCIQTMLENERCSPGGNNKLWYRYVDNNNSATKRSITRRRKLRLPYPSETGFWFYREPRRQRLHLQHRSGKTHSGKRFGAHGIPRHDVNGDDSGFPDGTPDNRREVYRGYTLIIHICALQFDHSVHRTLNVLGLSEVQDQAWFENMFSVPHN